MGSESCDEVGGYGVLTTVATRSEQTEEIASTEGSPVLEKFRYVCSVYIHFYSFDANE